MKFTCRKVDVHNPIVAEGIATMHDETFDEGEWLGQRVPNRGDWWIALNGKEPAGYAGMIPSVRVANAGYLCRAGVLPKFRGHGLQKKLIRLRVAHAKRLGWSVVFSDTIENPASGNSLIACGFRLYYPDKPYGSDGALYWRLRIGDLHAKV